MGHRLGMYYKEKDRDKRALNKCEHLLDHAHIKVYMYFIVCIIIYSGLYFELLTIIWYNFRLKDIHVGICTNTCTGNIICTLRRCFLPWCIYNRRQNWIPLRAIKNKRKKTQLIINIKTCGPTLIIDKNRYSKS